MSDERPIVRGGRDVEALVADARPEPCADADARIRATIRAAEAVSLADRPRSIPLRMAIAASLLFSMTAALGGFLAGRTASPRPEAQTHGVHVRLTEDVLAPLRPFAGSMPAMWRPSSTGDES